MTITETLNTFGELSDVEFNQIMDTIASSDFHDLPMTAFATALASIGAKVPNEAVLSAEKVARE